jgi:hypothetical protein
VLERRDVVVEHPVLEVQQHRPPELPAQPVDRQGLGGVDREPDLVLAEAAGAHAVRPPDALRRARAAGVDVKEGDESVGIDAGLVERFGAREALVRVRRSVDRQQHRAPHAVGVLVGQDVLDGAPEEADVLVEVDDHGRFLSLRPSPPLASGPEERRPSTTPLVTP